MPDWDRSFVAATAERVRLGVDPRRRRHGQGSHLGAGPGASLEFHDHRQYLAGDDLRHLDWGVYARTDQLMIRRYRQEVSPRVEILADRSVSMASEPAKAHLAATLVALLLRLARDCGSRPILWVLGDGPVRIGGEEDWARCDWDGSAGPDGPVPPGLGSGADRYLVSDGLARGGGRRVADRLGRDAGRICLIQVLSRQEADPEPVGAVRFEDVEGGVLELVHDAECCATYRRRFDRHQEAWRQALAGRGAGVVTCMAEEGPRAALRALLAAGVCEAESA